jgi:hypothetical protein
MRVRIEKSGSVWTVIHSRPEARKAMDGACSDALVAAFEQSTPTRRPMSRCFEAKAVRSVRAGI